MGKAITPEERIELFFRECTAEQALTQYERIGLILRTRKIGGTPPKRGRPRKKKEAPPLMAGGQA